MKNFTITHIGDTELSLPMPFIFIPARGKKFIFQKCDGSNIIKNDPIKEITFKNDYFLCAYPITQEFWEAVVKESNSSEIKYSPNRYIKKSHPVEQVNLKEIEIFKNELNTLLLNARVRFQNKETIGGNFTLPSEAQWEYAANADQDFVFSGSQNLNDVAWYSRNSNFRTMPVGLKMPNAWGLYDMSGNVWEACDNDFEIIQIDGEPGNNENRKLIPLRGGDCSSKMSLCSFRLRYNTVNIAENHLFGFRLLFSPNSTLKGTIKKL